MVVEVVDTEACGRCNRTKKFTFDFVHICVFFFFQAEDGIRDLTVTGVQTCALPILRVVKATRSKTLLLWSAPGAHWGHSTQRPCNQFLVLYFCSAIFSARSTKVLLDRKSVV